MSEPELSGLRAAREDARRKLMAAEESLGYTRRQHARAPTLASRQRYVEAMARHELALARHEVLKHGMPRASSPSSAPQES